MGEGKTEIVQHHTKAIAFVRSLDTIREDQWRTEIGKGKWTVAEVIGHLIPWDEFVLHKRIPYLFTDGKLPKGPDANTINAKSALKAREQDKKVMIDEFILVRSALLSAIDEIPNSRWEEALVIGETRLNLFEYFNGLVKHDIHHFEQVKGVLQE
ncbi:DinB family protein [Virgibacillus oceani]